MIQYPKTNDALGTVNRGNPCESGLCTLCMSDCKGKWTVLLFYPADFTFVCPTELTEAADLYDEFKKEGAEIESRV